MKTKDSTSLSKSFMRVQWVRPSKNILQPHPNLFWKPKAQKHLGIAAHEAHAEWTTPPPNQASIRRDNLQSAWLPWLRPTLWALLSKWQSVRRWVAAHWQSNAACSHWWCNLASNLTQPAHPNAVISTYWATATEYWVLPNSLHSRTVAHLPAQKKVVHCSLTSNIQSSSHQSILWSHFLWRHKA